MRYALQLAVAIWLAAWVAAGQQPPLLSHPAQRPLPVVSTRPLPATGVRCVDAVRGDDANPGTVEAPWRTLAHAATQLAPGTTLCLRGGTWYEPLALRQVRGTFDAPITIRSYPGELAVLDGGIRDFFEAPATAWEPVSGGASHEYRSVRAFPELPAGPDQVNLMGRFADSMVPLHGYRFLADFRSDNYVWNLPKNSDGGAGIYGGPGLWLDPETHRIHVRLAPTHLPDLGDANYSGPTDPRLLPLVVAGRTGQAPITLDWCAYVRLEDLVCRGTPDTAMLLRHADAIALDGVTVYGGNNGLSTDYVRGLRALNCAFRGIAAPWTSRAHLKYRSVEARVLSAGRWNPGGNADFELAYCEFTDSVDGVFVGNVDGVRLHHSYLDSFSDDGLFLTAGTGYDGLATGGPALIYQNLISRCLTAFAFGVGHGRQKALAGGHRQTGDGVWITRNVLDFRGPVLYHPPVEEGGDTNDWGARSCCDHGSPNWEPLHVYHNTIMAHQGAFRDYYVNGWGGFVQTSPRRVFNNIDLQVTGLPGRVFAPGYRDLQADGNLHWSIGEGPAYQGDFLKLVRQGVASAARTQPPPPPPPPPRPPAAPGTGAGDDTLGLDDLAPTPPPPPFVPPVLDWASRDRWGDPAFVNLPADWRAAVDLRLQPGSPAIDAGVPVPGDWFDPLRAADTAAPDIGAIPAGASGWRVGIGGRLQLFGDCPEPDWTTAISPWPRLTPVTNVRRVAVVAGYPAPDAPLIEDALRQRYVEVEEFDKVWLDVARYADYELVALIGDFPRARMVPERLGGQDVAPLRAWLESGGTLLVGWRNQAVFGEPEPAALWREIAGTPEVRTAADTAPELLQPEHPWVKHLAGQPLDWLERAAPAPIAVGRGATLIGNAATAVLWDAPVGKGRVIYLGWDPARLLPPGREPSTPELEARWEIQYRVVMAMMRELFPDGP